MIPLVLLAALSSAQDAIDAHGFTPAAYDGDLRDPLRLQRPGRFRFGEWFAGAIAEYAHDPLVRVRYGSDGTTERDPILGSVAALNLNGGVAVWDRIRLDASLPVVLLTSDPEPDGAVIRGPAFGDLRLRALGAIIRPELDDLGFGLGVSAHLDAPIGANARYLGQSGFAGGGDVSASYAWDRLTLTANAGAQFNPKADLVNLYGADQLHLGLAGSWLFSDSLSASLEAQFMPALQPSTRAGTQSPAEITATVRHRAPSGVNLLGGAAVGAGPGAGAAAFRLFFGAGFGKINNDIPPDADGDGIVGDDDACPEVAEIVNGLDDLDGCPDALTTWRVGASVDGAPIDGATVTVTPIAPTRGLPRTFPSTLALTHSEELPGSAYEASANHGSCLAGAANVTIGAAPLSTLIPLSPVRNSRIRFEISGPDGQPIDAETELVHPQRACAPTGTLRVGADGTEIIPVGAGEMEVLVRADGFRSVRMPIVVSEGGEELIKLSLAPAKVKVESNRILILEKVFFDFNKASIQAQSFSLLEEVANTLRDHPQIASVEVGGHTDDKGNDAYNLKLSQERADAIRAWLVAHGIDASRLTARGYGEAKPIADNATEPGRDKNRRVEFTIVKWVDGS